MTNEVLIYDYIGRDGVTAKQVIKSLATIDEGDVHIRINSPGGSVFEGMAIFNAIRRQGNRIVTHIDGLAASMGSVIALAGDEVRMAGNALMMIHNPWSLAIGDSEDMRREAELLDKIKKQIVDIYMERSGAARSDVEALMDLETWFDSEEASEFDFVDEVEGDRDAQASFDLSVFQRVPEQAWARFGEKTPAGAGTNPEKEVPAMTEINTPATPDRYDEGIAAERQRVADIQAVFEPFGAEYSELERQCINDGETTADNARAALLRKMGEGAEPTAGTSVLPGADERDRFVEGASLALAMRAGLEEGERNEFSSLTLIELARESLRRSNGKLGSNRMDTIANAFTHTTSDFTTLLKNTANKSMLKGFDEVEETFQAWTSEGEVPDFKQVDRVDLSVAPALDLVPEGAEYKFGTLGDRGETVQVYTYGKLFSITRQAIINDDLAAFSRVPRRMGRAALRTIGNTAYAILTAPATLADGVTIFHASRNNTGTGGVITTASLDELDSLIAKQTETVDGEAVTLNLRGKYLIVPRVLAGLARQVISSQTEIGASQNNSRKPNYAPPLEVITDARLDTASATAYYVAADPSMHDTAEVTYLEGQKRPVLEQQQGWSIDGTEFKVRIDFGVSALDYRGFANNAGA